MAKYNQTNLQKVLKPRRKQMVWSEFWKGFEEWYNGESWERQVDMLKRMFSKYVGEQGAKRIIKAFDVLSADVNTGDILDTWRNQERLFEDLYRIEITYRKDDLYNL